MRKIIQMLLFAVFLVSCGNKDVIGFIESDEIEILDEIPRYYPSRISSFQVDLRCKDLSKANIAGRKYDLLHSAFGNMTRWPSDINSDCFNPHKILNLNANPGMGIRELHRKGITGQGVKIAIVDQPNNLYHKEYGDRITFHDDIPERYSSRVHLHGPAVTSLAIGKNIGVAPGASAVYFATENVNEEHDYTCLGNIRALDGILKYNRGHEDKISVVSISTGASEDWLYYDDYRDKTAELREQGIVVISCDLFLYNRDMQYYGLKKDPLDDPDRWGNYDAIGWDTWLVKIHKFPKIQKKYVESLSGNQDNKTLMIPLDGSTITAGFLTESHYTYKFVSGWSWCPPYLAGLFALCRQVKQDITLEEFWSKAYESGRAYTFQANNQTIKGMIVDPVSLIDSL